MSHPHKLWHSLFTRLVESHVDPYREKEVKQYYCRVCKKIIIKEFNDMGKLTAGWVKTEE